MHVTSCFFFAINGEKAVDISCRNRDRLYIQIKILFQPGYTPARYKHMHAYIHKVFADSTCHVYFICVPVCVYTCSLSFSLNSVMDKRLCHVQWDRATILEFLIHLQSRCFRTEVAFVLNSVTFQIFCVTLYYTYIISGSKAHSSITLYYRLNITGNKQ